MENNIGATDRLTRIAVGFTVALVGLAALGGLLELGTMVGAVLSLVGLVLVGTGLARVCLLYRLFGIDTARP
jgi:hypothetical protein